MIPDRSNDPLNRAVRLQSVAQVPADIAPCRAADLAQIVIALRNARRALTRADEHAAAEHVQFTLDQIDPRLSIRLGARLRSQAVSLEADPKGGGLALDATAGRDVSL